MGAERPPVVPKRRAERDGGIIEPRSKLRHGEEEPLGVEYITH